MSPLPLLPKLLQQTLETTFYSGGVDWDEVSPNDAAALLKKFIRELPSPLLTAEHLNTFSAVRGESQGPGPVPQAPAPPKPRPPPGPGWLPIGC